MSSCLAAITVYPVKSLDGLAADGVAVLPSGALAGDREWALFDPAGAVVNTKRTARLCAVRARFSADGRKVALGTAGRADREFLLESAAADAAAWLTDALGEAVELRRDVVYGFPDDLAVPGPTLVSTATLETVAGWFGLPLNEARRRFRTNLEVGGVPAFWEDTLVGAAPETGTRLRIGGAVWRAASVCQRCTVPTRDSRSGEARAGFQREFMRRREEALPAAARRGRFNHFYRLTLNLAPVSVAPDTVLHAGDAVEVRPP
ncbi:MAG: MOSC domain-containing protein [Limisphaerales bacterium]